MEDDRYDKMQKNLLPKSIQLRGISLFSGTLTEWFSYSYIVTKIYDTLKMSYILKSTRGEALNFAHFLVNRCPNITEF